jgi:hypothetical protein
MEVRRTAPAGSQAIVLAALTLKTPGCNGTTRLAMSLLEFMQRLSALVPPSASRRRIQACECR